MVEVHKFTEPAELFAKLEQYNETRAVVVLTGGIDESTGKSWCGPCERAKPRIQEIVCQVTQGVVLYGIVPEKTQWVGVADHPYKLKFGVKYVPSMILFDCGQLVHKVHESAEFENDDLMKMFYED